MNRETEWFYFIIQKKFMAFGLILLFMLTGIQHVWAAGFGVENNQITINTDTNSYTPSIDATGSVDTVASMAGNITDMRFTIVKDTVDDGTYNLDLGIIVDDATNDRLIEATLLGVQVVVSGNSLNVTVPTTTELQIAGRSWDGNTVFVATFANNGVDTPVTGSGSETIVDLANIVTKVENKFGDASNEANILNEIASEGSYTYSVFLKTASTPMGYVSGTVGSYTVTPFTSQPVDILETYSAAGYADSSLEADLSTTATIPGSPTDAELSPISNPTYLNGNCYIMDGAYSVGDVGILGDANGDGSVDIFDALLVAQLAAEIITELPDPTANVDVNSDGSSNIFDALLIAQYAAELITEWP